MHCLPLVYGIVQHTHTQDCHVKGIRYHVVHFTACTVDHQSFTLWIAPTVCRARPDCLHWQIGTKVGLWRCNRLVTATASFRVPDSSLALSCRLEGPQILNTPLSDGLMHAAESVRLLSQALCFSCQCSGPLTCHRQRLRHTAQCTDDRPAGRILPPPTGGRAKTLSWV